MSDRDKIKNLLFGNFIPACTVMCRKNVLMEIHGFKQVNHVPYVDYTTWLKISLKGKFVYLDQMLGYWRHHEKQISINMSLEMVESMEYSTEFFRGTCKEQNDFNDLNITDLIIYDLNQAKYNFLYLLKTHETKKNETVSKVTNVRSSIKLKKLLNIFYIIFKINIIWSILLLKKRC